MLHSVSPSILGQPSRSYFGHLFSITCCGVDGVGHAGLSANVCCISDQLFGYIAFILSTAHDLATPQNLLDRIRKTMALPRPQNRKLYLGKVDQVLDWCAMVTKLGISFSGYTGPHAPHSVRIMRRKCPKLNTSNS